MKVRVGDLKFNERLLTARPVNAVFVSRYRQAYRSGCNLGEIVVNKKTMEIVSGNHRVTALLQEYGADHEIDVTARVFPDDLSVLKCFAEANAAHGNALSGASRRAVTLMMLEAGATTGEVANLFGVSVHRIEVWGDQTVMVITGKGKSEPKPSKAGIPLGTTMKKAQYDTHWKADRGIAAYSQAEQLIRWIRNGWIDTECVRTMTSLTELQKELEGFLGKYVKDAA